MAKTQGQTDNGGGWFWYEVTRNTDASAIAAVGNRVPGSFRDGVQRSLRLREALRHRRRLARGPPDSYLRRT